MDVFALRERLPDSFYLQKPRRLVPSAASAQTPLGLHCRALAFLPVPVERAAGVKPLLNLDPAVLFP